eukprot:TRINITY_DN285_c0_g1_i3.p2 TRINITY_DN285_c0_g1~~TRINITY_DN285_c0_g1_i3.p2  ORF type:complete len:119 (-),score=22.21 TRINITY_DN285_c0_g1_i3:144-500(-)
MPIDVGADTIDKSYRAYLKHQHAPHKWMAVADQTVDTGVWQCLASVLIPGFTINRVVAVTKFVTDRSPLPSLAKRSIPTAVGLGIIPFIVHPIDHLVDQVMDRTYRKWMAAHKANWKV